jgi:hypothetical protein
MEYFVQQLINGVTLGSIYGLIAIGYTMVYGIIGMINFAHGDIYMVGAFLALLAFLALIAIGVTAIPLALFLVLLIAMALCALYGWTVERFAYRPLRGSFRLAPLISGVSINFFPRAAPKRRLGRGRTIPAFTKKAPAKNSQTSCDGMNQHTEKSASRQSGRPHSPNTLGRTSTGACTSNPAKRAGGGSDLR